jgi:hypothetical protein
MKRLVTPDAISVDASGIVPVSAFVEIWGEIKVTGHATRDMRVIPLSEDAALVTYKLMQVGTIAGTPIAPELYATTAWTRRNGKWQAVFHQEAVPTAAS